MVIFIQNASYACFGRSVEKATWCKPHKPSRNVYPRQRTQRSVKKRSGSPDVQYQIHHRIPCHVVLFFFPQQQLFCDSLSYQFRFLFHLGTEIEDSNSHEGYQTTLKTPEIVSSDCDCSVIEKLEQWDPSKAFNSTGCLYANIKTRLLNAVYF